MDKDILIQYVDMIEEIKDIRKRKEKMEKDIEKLCAVSDSVKGTRDDGTYGRIRITGYPTPEYYRKKALIDRYKKLLTMKEEELLELTIQAEEFIQTIEKSELRNMFRLYFMDGLSYLKVAIQMNHMFPVRKIAYTDENVKKRIQRYFENVQQCPDC